MKSFVLFSIILFCLSSYSYPGRFGLTFEKNFLNGFNDSFHTFGITYGVTNHWRMYLNYGENLNNKTNSPISESWMKKVLIGTGIGATVGAISGQSHKALISGLWGLFGGTLANVGPSLKSLFHQSHKEGSIGVKYSFFKTIGYTFGLGLKWKQKEYTDADDLFLKRYNIVSADLIAGAFIPFFITKLYVEFLVNSPIKMIQTRNLSFSTSVGIEFFL